MTPIGPQCQLGECPLWDGRIDRLHLIDIEGRAVHRLDPFGDTVESRSLTGRPGSMALTNNPDRLVVAVEHELVSLSWSTGAVGSLVDIEAPGPGKRLNDGRCDPGGRFWVGSMDDPHDTGLGRGHLYRVDAVTGDGCGNELNVSHHRDGVGVSNGMAFSPDGTVMYWADSPRGLVWRYDVDPRSGERGNEKVFLDFSRDDLPGAPDGACVDDTGCYWVACVNGSALLRVTPEGRVDRIIELPVAMPTMPAFGGPDLDVVFVTSIGDDRPGSGTTLMLDGLGVRGVPEPVFSFTVPG